MEVRRLELCNNNERACVGGRWALLKCWLEGQAGLVTEWGSRAPGKGAGQDH